MALENCFLLSSVCNTRATAIQSNHCHFSSVEKTHLPTFRGLNKPNLSFSSSFAHSFNGRCQKSRLICIAREAFDQVLVQFWAPWCGPCHMIEPVIADLAKDYAGKIACYKFNTDESPNIATQFGIRSIPTMLFFKNGEKKERIIGAVSKSTVASSIDNYIDT
ncbi:Thioredoxin M-type [Hibiscus syriacus]|uniref:Thioredoxin M-type n=1 Tax=Hibiscus syriacus TaxID=106335 RepID=A0A6A2Y490_HIBSY|nr:Thioredoxin M-type [Hibiscus syriacus]